MADKLYIDFPLSEQAKDYLLQKGFRLLAPDPENPHILKARKHSDLQSTSFSSRRYAGLMLEATDQYDRQTVTAFLDLGENGRWLGGTLKLMPHSARRIEPVLQNMKIEKL